jgi:bilirubin oxidase
MGWKDTVRVESGERLRIIMRFTDFTDEQNPYMYHCHILEHEDRGMMGQFLVV